MPFDPSALPGIVLNCEADAITPVSSGTAVGTWTNAGGLSLGDLTNAGATGTKPTYQTGDASNNSKPFLRFVAGSSQTLTSANAGTITQYYAVVRAGAAPFAGYGPPLGSSTTNYAGQCLISKLTWSSVAPPGGVSVNGVAMTNDGGVAVFPLDDTLRWKVLKVEVANPASSRNYKVACDNGSFGSWDVCALFAFSADLGATDEANLTAYLVGKYLPAAPAAGTVPSAYPSSGLVHYADAASRVYTDMTGGTACTDLTTAGMWQGLTSNGIAWTQGKSTWRPLYLAAGLNGRPCLRFNGQAAAATNPTAWMSAGMPSQLEALANGSFSVVVVGRLRQSSGTQTLVSKGNNGVASLPWLGTGSYVWSRLTTFVASGTNPASPRNKGVFTLIYTFANSGTDTGTETIYLGGVPVATRTGSVPSWSSGSNWRMGCQDLYNGPYALLGDIARVAVYNRALTASEAIAIGNDASATYAKARVFFEGDSLTAGSGATVDGDYPGQVVIGGYDQIPLEMFDVGVGGTTISQMTTRAPTTVDPYLVPGQTNVIVLLDGTNSLSANSGSAEYAAVVAYLAARKAAGQAVGAVVKTVLVLPPPFPGGTAQQETNRQAYMTLARANALSSGSVDALVDYADDPYIGLFSSYADQPSYWFNTAHLTNAGYAVMAGHVRAKVVSLLQAASGGRRGGILTGGGL